MECHGNINYMQCETCWTVEKIDDLKFEFDKQKKESKLIPKCERCETNLRPNIMFWNDIMFMDQRFSKVKA